MPAFAKKKYIKLSKGFYGTPGRCISAMIPKVDRALRFAYISRRLRPREYRSQWINTIGSAVRDHNINYSRFINCLTYSNIGLDRKILADLSINQPYSFKSIVDQVKIQNEFEPIMRKNGRRHTVQDMILKNLLIKAKLPDEAYEREEKEIKTQFLEDQYRGIPQQNK